MMEQKTNYNEIYKKTVEEIARLKEKPTLFLHACCGPCLTYPLTELVKYFKVTVGYINRNIYPQEEYDLRKEELIRFVKEFNLENNLDIEIVVMPYEYDILHELLSKYGPLPEGDVRCTFCHEYRMELAYKYAEENGFDYFTTVMTVSSKKPSEIINEIGMKLSSDRKTKYLLSDFKKENGQLKGIQIAKKHNLYRQNYCGCYYSYEDMKKRKNS